MSHSVDLHDNVVVKMKYMFRVKSVTFRFMVQCKSLPKFMRCHFCFNNIVVAKIRSLMNFLKFELKFSAIMKYFNIRTTETSDVCQNCMQVTYHGGIYVIRDPKLLTLLDWSQSRSLLQSCDFHWNSYTLSWHICGCDHIIRTLKVSKHASTLACLRDKIVRESKHSHNITFQSIYI
jgi:hypothetical protein